MKEGSKLRPGGSVGQWSQIRITLIRSRIGILIEVRIRIRFQVKGLIWIRGKVIWIQNPAFRAYF